jgi:hypothetical protein
MRMKDERVTKKALKGYVEGRRPVVRPKGRGIDKVARETEGMLKCRTRRKSAEGRDAWRQRIEEPKDQVVLWRHIIKIIIICFLPHNKEILSHARFEFPTTIFIRTQIFCNLTLFYE